MTSQHTDDLAIAQQFLTDNPDIETIEVMVTDLNGSFRGKWLTRDNLEKVFKGDVKLALTTVSPDVWGRDVGSLCDKTGDGDGVCLPIVSTLKRLPWLERPTAQMFMQLTGDDGQPWGYDPRVVLQNVYKRYQALGLRPVTAPELEFHLFLEKRDDMGVPQLPDTRINGKSHMAGQLYGIDVMQEQSALMHDIRDAAVAMDLPLDGLLKELAPAQYELNLNHIDNPLHAADNAQMLKRVIKGVAQKHGYIATFMAKPFGDMDGNGMHIHCSVLDNDGNNIFDDGTEAGTDTLRHAIAGLAQTMSDTMLIFAPHFNSYRRFKVGSHIPKAPTWGYENRDVAMRVPSGSPKARRIEYRVGGADLNPYLAQAALLSGILYGIENKLEADAPLNDSVNKPEASLPRSWRDALELFEASTYVKEHLGAPFQEAFSAVKHAEQEEFEGRVSAFEYDTYLVGA
ncbi:glutamine synthetase family protein [Dasania marina]|uniref:glutamine synthetase family protein n=1 Tax=Dasania marina TaxID=471499 RepID=UPI00035D9EBC|nr:glutamine synthetase family protein [Dasania marina]